MSVIDIFSRFLFLSPLQTNETSEVAEHLSDIYIEQALQKFCKATKVQSFKGVLKIVCETLNVRTIKSSAYSTQTEGKDERSHRTWKEKIKFDLINNNNGDLNWVEHLQQYQQLYNEPPHRSLGQLFPL